MFCEHCGKRLNDGDRFCAACGHPVQIKPRRQEFLEEEDDRLEEKTPKIRKRKPEPEYDNRMTAGMGYGYHVNNEPDPEDEDNEDYEEEWEREEKKEKITFAVLGVIIVILVVAIIFGVVKLMGSGSGEGKKVSQLNEQMKEEMQKSQQKEETEDNETAVPTDEAVQEQETVTPEVTVTPEITPEVAQEVSPDAGAQNQETATQQDIPATPAPTQEPAEQQEETSDTETAAQSATTSGDYVIPDSSTRYLSNADLAGLSEWQIRIARNEIYARHGRIFKSDDMVEYFTAKSWYTPSVPPEQFDNSYLNAIEIDNVKLITAYEKAHNLNQ